MSATSAPVSLTIDLPPDLVEALDAWLTMHPSPTPDRAQAVTYALRDWLTGFGLLPFYDDPEMAN